MKNSPVQIGHISLRDFEVPSSVRFGGRHRVAIHHLAGGNRVVERLGPDDSEIMFHGTFSGPDAENRVRAFDALRLSGEAVWLTWESFRRKIIVKNFIADYQSPSWILYKICCLAVTQEGVQTASIATSAMSILADLGSALLPNIGSSVGLPELQSALLQKDVFVDGTQNNSQATAAVASSLAAINTQIIQQTDVVMAGTAASVSRDRFAGLFGITVNSAGSLAAAINAKSYIGRIGVSLGGLIV